MGSFKYISAPLELYLLSQGIGIQEQNTKNTHAENLNQNRKYEITWQL